MSNARKLAANLPREGQLSGRNMIQNGAFIVDQRELFTARTVTTGSQRFVDRWGFYSDSGATNNYSATSQAVDDGPPGFNKSLKFTVTGQTGAIPATSEVILRQVLEGYQTNRLNFGTANAKNSTLSFWVKSSIAGNFGFTAQYVDSGGTNLYNLRSYTVNSANTWEYKIISIPKNTSNAFQQKTHLPGFRLNWDLGEGATYSGSVTGNWQSAYVNGLSGGVKIANTNGATWQITGVMLEEGDQASPFEYEDYDRTLETCQRYYQTSGQNRTYGLPFNQYTTTNAYSCMRWWKKMRVTPTITMNSLGNYNVYHAAASRGKSAVGISQLSANSGEFYITTDPLTAGYCTHLNTNGDTYMWLADADF